MFLKMAKAEKFVIENIAISDLIKEDFLEKLKKIDMNIFPVSLLFINEKEKEGVKQAFPLILNHQNNEEVKNRILHVESPNTELVKALTKILEEK